MYRAGIDLEASRFGPGGTLILGGVPIPGCAALLGYHDGDVLCRALAEALLGAVAMGVVEPNLDETLATATGIASAEILRKAVDVVRAKNMRLVNVDATLYGPRTKLAAELAAMRSQLEDLLDLPAERISVKLRPSEAAGLLGHHDGISALAVAMVSSQPLA